MVYVLVQGARIVGVFESIFHAKSFFSDATGVKFSKIVEERSINGDILFKIDNYTQARLKETIFY